MTSETWRPVRAVGVFTRRSGENTLIEGYIDAYETNHVGALIWSLCDSVRSQTEIAAAVADHYGITLDRATTSTGTFLGELRARGFVS